MISGTQLSLYYGVGLYVSANLCKGEGVVVCDRVVTVINISGVSTWPLMRLMRFGVILNTLLIGIRY